MSTKEYLVTFWEQLGFEKGKGPQICGVFYPRETIYQYSGYTGRG